MPASGYGNFAQSTGPQTNAAAAMSLTPPSGDSMGARLRLDQLIISSAGGAVVAAVRLLIAITIQGTRQTLGFQIPATAFGEPVSIAFLKGLLADPGTGVDVTLPALGTGIVGEVVALWGVQT